MLFTCSAHCTDPTHRHGRAAATKRKAVTSVRAAAVTKAKRKTADLRIDVHCHYLNTAVAAKVAHLKPLQYEPSVIYANALTNEVNSKQMKDRGAKLSSIEVRLRDMDKMGVDIQVVSPAPFQYYYWAEASLGRTLSREVNEGIAALVAGNPDRFVGLGTVPLQNADMAVKELEYASKVLGLRGVELNTNVNGLDLTDPSLKLEKFFRRAEELEMPLFLHPVGFTQGQRLVDHYFNNVIGNPLDTTSAVSHLILDGVMARNPKLKVLVAHGGAYLAHYWARMDHAHRARADVRSVIKKPPSSYLAKMYFDTITFDPEMLANLVRKYGSDHVMLGTDYPYDMGEDDPVGHIRSVKGLSAVDRQRIMGGNARKLFKIKGR